MLAQNAETSAYLDTTTGRVVFCTDESQGDNTMTEGSDPADVPKILTMAEGFCVRQEIDNIAWIDLGGSGLVVDALERPELEAEVFAAISETFGATPVNYVINTHTHYDHVALNDAFKRRWGSEIVSAATCDIPPEGRWFEGTARKVQMLPMPNCHTPEDCIVWAPDDRVLFVGDIFGWGVIPLIINLRADSAALLKSTYARLIEFDAAVVVPGHGPLCTNAELARWIEYLQWLCEGIGRARGDGASDEQIAKQFAPPEDMRTWWRFLAWKHEDCLSKVLKSVRNGWLDA